MAGASAAAVAARSWVADPLTSSGRALFLVLVVAGGLVEGIALGAGQALVLRGTVSHARRWIGASGLAFAAAMVVIFLGSSAPAPSWFPLAVVGVGAGTGLTEQSSDC